MNEETQDRQAWQAWYGETKETPPGVPTPPGRPWMIRAYVDGAEVDAAFSWYEDRVAEALDMIKQRQGAWVVWYAPVRDRESGQITIHGHANRHHPAYWCHLAVVAWERMWAWLLPYRIIIERKRQNHDEDE